MKDSEFLHILAKYKFVLAIENAVCPDYITEKLWKVLQVGAVPVYFGAPNVQVCMVIKYFIVHQASYVKF
jgi:alpha-1,3-fucosyltransferase 10